MKRRLFLVSLMALPLAPAALGFTPKPDFSGTWKQSNDRCVPKRTGDVIRHIDQRDSDLVVETTVLRPSGPPRHAVQRYSTDGKTSVSIGSDGDEFHTSIVWKDQTLVFSVEEHEEGRILLSKETWSLIENGSALQINREPLNASADGPRKQTLLYLRQSSDGSSR